MSTAELIPELNARPGDSARATHARSYVPYLLFALSASLYFFPFMRLLMHGGDEGILVEGAMRTLHGQLLGRDFLEVVGPGTFYWLALFFKVFGATFLASRICLFVSSLGTALSIYFLSRRICNTYQVLPCILIFATYFGVVWPATSHHVDSNCFALLAVVCMVLWLDSRKSVLLLAAGALAGATTLTLQPKGILLLLAFLVWLSIQHWRKAAPLTALGWVTGGWVAVIGLLLGYFWSRGALSDLIYVNVVWPSHNYGPAFSVHYAAYLLDNFTRWIVPMPGLNWTIGMATVLLIPFLFVAVLPVVLICLGIRHGVRKLSPEIILYWMAGAALWLSEVHRKDICHLVLGSPLLIILCVFYLQAHQNRGFSLATQVLSITSVCLATATLMIALIARPMATRAGEVRMTAYDPVPAAIDEHVPPGGEMFIYPYAPMYYFLSGTTNPTRYSVLYYNFKIHSRPTFDEAIQTLTQHHVKYVWWDRSAEDQLLILFPGADLKQNMMERYLTSHYRAVWTCKTGVLMERIDDDHNN